MTILPVAVGGALLVAYQTYRLLNTNVNGMLVGGLVGTVVGTVVSLIIISRRRSTVVTSTPNRRRVEQTEIPTIYVVLILAAIFIAFVIFGPMVFENR